MDKLYRGLLRFGTVRVLIIVIIIAISLAQIILTLIRWLFNSSPDSFTRDTIIATLIPMVVASIISSITVRLAIRLDQTLKHISELAITDSLTGIHNRRYFMDRVEDEFTKAVRYGLAVSLIMLDVDYFKRINDVYGHACGDIVLRAIAKTCRDSLRSFDVLARYGGEEFVILLLLSDKQTASFVAERIRSRVAALELSCVDGEIFHVTVSLGVATRSEKISSIDNWLKFADMAMYRAKESGRNQVQYSDEFIDTNVQIEDNENLQSVQIDGRRDS